MSFSLAPSRAILAVLATCCGAVACGPKPGGAKVVKGEDRLAHIAAAVAAEGLFFVPHLAPEGAFPTPEGDNVAPCVTAGNEGVAEALLEKLRLKTAPPSQDAAPLSGRWDALPAWAKSWDGPRYLVHVEAIRCARDTSMGDSKPASDVAAAGQVSVGVYDRQRGELVVEIVAQKAASVRRDAVRLAAESAAILLHPREKKD